MHANETLISGFYEAFARRDAETMAAAYADDATFSDPVFPSLTASEARAMWRMFCERGNDLSVTFSDVRADGTTGSARWEAVYTFGGTGRRVHNRIVASFDLSGGRITRHVDDFDFYRWTRMALGPVGTLLGWTPVLKQKVRGTARRQLDRFIAGDS